MFKGNEDDYAPGTGQPDGIDRETGVAPAPDPEMFGSADRVAPAPDSSMFGPPTDLVAPPPDAATLPSRFQPIETQTPRNKELNPPPPNTGQEPGLEPGSLPYGLHTTQAQAQSVRDDRGVVTTFISDLPEK